MAYRWNHPHEWLSEKIDDLVCAGDVQGLRSLVVSVMGLLDGDAIQDVFQSEMDGDQYFDQS